MEKFHTDIPKRAAISQFPNCETAAPFYCPKIFHSFSQRSTQLNTS